MSIENGKQPAFPNSSLETAFGSAGLSKREIMAMNFMAARIAANQISRFGSSATESVSDADALLKALEESTPRESPIDMLKTIVDHSNEPAMDDAQFRKFARGNAQYVIDSQKGGENG